MDGFPEDTNYSFVVNIFLSIIGRRPSPEEVNYGINQISSGQDPRNYIGELLSSPEAEPLFLAKTQAPLFVPPGHYYSPVVNVADFAASRASHTRASGLEGIAYNPARQLDYFKKLSRHFESVGFPVSRTDAFRYYFENDFFSYGDALILSAFIQEVLPRRIIEIGSGFSSAVMLDTLDRMGVTASEIRCTFVEPYAGRLKSLLRPDDYDRTTIIEKPIQLVDLRIFSGLEANDILFLDTTHILKTGSDVNHELFHVLPSLKAGVMIHFHDVFDGFEYPDDWILHDNRSWNELYALRAFLMHNAKYEILLMNDTVAKRFPDEAYAISRAFMKNPGGGLYLRKL
jgi:predicted O-methyltransferase YrrM